MQDVYKNIEEYNVGKKRKMLIDFDDIFTNMINNKNLNRMVTKLVIRGRNINTSIVFITQSYFKVPKDVLYTLFLSWKFQIKESFKKLL